MKVADRKHCRCRLHRQLASECAAASPRFRRSASAQQAGDCRSRQEAFQQADGSLATPLRPALWVMGTIERTCSKHPGGRFPNWGA